MYGLDHRVTIFAGHYGSGKTCLALNWARRLKAAAPGAVAIADLDIVNPYFRTKDEAGRLRDEGIELVVSEYANSNVDFPALPGEIYRLVADRSVRVVMDVGGDDRGALALGRYVDDLKAEGDFDFVAVVNRSRPLTRTVAGAVECLREIEAAARLPFTAVVNNTNLGPDTTAAAVLEGVDYARAIAAELKVPLAFSAAEARLRDELAAAGVAAFPLELQRLYYRVESASGIAR